MRRYLCILILMIAYGSLVGCGGGTVTPTSNTTTTTGTGTTTTGTGTTTTPRYVMTVSPSPIVVAPGGQVQISATVTDTTTGLIYANTALNMTVQEGTTGGTILNSTTYQAPQTSGTYHLVITDILTLATKTVPVTVQVSGTLTISPTTFTIGKNIVRVVKTFDALINGSVVNSSVNWTVVPPTANPKQDCGTVGMDGTYVSGTAPDGCEVVATSKTDAAQTAAATIHVQ